MRVPTHLTGKPGSQPGRPGDQRPADPAEGMSERLGARRVLGDCGAPPAPTLARLPDGAAREQEGALETLNLPEMLRAQVTLTVTAGHTAPRCWTGAKTATPRYAGASSPAAAPPAPALQRPQTARGRPLGPALTLTALGRRAAAGLLAVLDGARLRAPAAAAPRRAAAGVRAGSAPAARELSGGDAGRRRRGRGGAGAAAGEGSRGSAPDLPRAQTLSESPRISPAHRLLCRSASCAHIPPPFWHTQPSARPDPDSDPTGPFPDPHRGCRNPAGPILHTSTSETSAGES